MVFTESEVGVNVKPAPRFRLAYELFRDAADSLFERVRDTFVHDRSSFKGILTLGAAQQLIPILFLYRHALELQLKEILARLDILDDKELDKKEKKRRYRHGLNALWLDVQERLPNHLAPEQSSELLEPLEDRLDYVEENLRRFDEVDPWSLRFRYPNEESHRLRFDILAFELHNQKTAAILDEVVNALGAFIDAR